MEIALIGLVALLALAFLGVPLGLAMIPVGVGGFAVLRGWTPATELLGQIIVDLSMTHSFSVLPLFVLMGTFIYRAALSEELYDTFNAWLGHHRGGLAMATIAACGGFAAVSGSSLATCATMAKVTMPSMRRFDYADTLASGSIAAGGTLGSLIPPSVGLVLYGILTNTDIGALFMAGIIPGILTVALYIASIVVVTRLDPDAGPRGPRAGWAERWRSLSKVWGVVVLFLFILGGIYLGIFTPTEAGGMGAVGALAFAVGRRRMSWDQFIESLVETGRTTGMIFTVGFGAIMLSNFITVSGMTGGLTNWVGSLGLPPIAVVLLLAGIYVLLGMVFDGLALILLTVPIFAPLIISLHLDLVWFGIFVIIVSEISMITPPIGMNVFVLRAVIPDLQLWTIFRGIVPFFVADIVRLLLIIFFPTIALLLPQLMK